MDLTIYLLIAFVIIFSLVVYCYCWCKRYHREIAQENGIQPRARTNSDHDFSYWANGWPVTDPSYSPEDRHHHQHHHHDHHHGCGATDSYQNSHDHSFHNSSHVDISHHYV